MVKRSNKYKKYVQEKHGNDKVGNVLVHGWMNYKCNLCKNEWVMFLEKGIEDFGENHKPSPFNIRCKCGGWASDISGINKLKNVILLPSGYSYFANQFDFDCGVPMLN